MAACHRGLVGVQVTGYPRAPIYITQTCKANGDAPIYIDDRLRGGWPCRLYRATGEPSVPDLIIAATAELAGLTVLHRDKDFDLIAGVTGQPAPWLNAA